MAQAGIRGTAALAALMVTAFLTAAQAGANGFQERVLERVAAIDEEEFVIYEPDTVEHTVVVFTDVNCPNCRNVHANVDDYLMWGIRIKYAAFPVIRDAQEKMEAVWCSDDRKDAMTRAKRDEPVGDGDCDNPVAEHLGIAQELGFRGTPAIVLPSGDVVYGDHSPAGLLDILEQDAAQ